MTSRTRTGLIIGLVAVILVVGVFGWLAKAGKLKIGADVLVPYNAKYDFNCDKKVDKLDNAVVNNFLASGKKKIITTITAEGKKCKNFGAYLGTVWDDQPMTTEQAKAINAEIEKNYSVAMKVTATTTTTAKPVACAIPISGKILDMSGKPFILPAGSNLYYNYYNTIDNVKALNKKMTISSNGSYSLKERCPDNGNFITFIATVDIFVGTNSGTPDKNYTSTPSSFQFSYTKGDTIGGKKDIYIASALAPVAPKNTPPTVKISNRSTGIGWNATLKKDKYRLTVNWTGNDAEDKTNLTYRYKLGINGPWSDWKPGTTYTGEYIYDRIASVPMFYVQAKDTGQLTGNIASW